MIIIRNPGKEKESCGQESCILDNAVRAGLSEMTLEKQGSELGNDLGNAEAETSKCKGPMVET